MSGKKSTTRPVFPKWAKPYLRKQAKAAWNLYNDPAHQMIPELNQWTTQGIGQRAAIAGGPTVGRASADEAMKILGGGYLDVTNDPRFQRNIGEAMGQASQRFAGSGRVGSGAYAGALGDAATGVAAEMYDQERQRMMQTLGMAPQLIGAQYADAAALESAGSTLDADAMARFDWPYARLDRLTNTLMGGNPAFTTPGSQTKTPFDWMALVTGMLSPQMPSGGK